MKQFLCYVCLSFHLILTITLQKNAIVPIVQEKKLKCRGGKIFPKVTQLVSDGPRI